MVVLKYTIGLFLALAHVCANSEDISWFSKRNNNEIPTSPNHHQSKQKASLKRLDKELLTIKQNRLNHLGMLAQTRSTDSPFQGCVNTSHPQTGFKEIPVFKLNLDDDPAKRWNEIMKQKRTEMKRLVDLFDQQFGSKLMRVVDKYVAKLHSTLPPEYAEELQGISQQTNINVGRVTLYNIFYEFFSVCTSIVLEGTDGQMYHGRNLDFGLFMGWDVKNHTWALTELLRPLIIKVEFWKKGNPLYSAITYAGYTGILTGIKKNAFSLTIDERFVLDGGYVGVAEWLLGDRHSSWLGLLTRQVLETAESYAQAKQLLTNTKLVAPAYFILAGPKAEGCIITRGRDKADVWELGGKHTEQTSSWYLVETNYDHWRHTPFYDKRRKYAVHCMEALGRSQPLDTLYSVLSTRPVLNKETTLTALMQVSGGVLMVWERNCEDPCWPF